MAVHTYPHRSDVLIHSDVVSRLWCSCNFLPARFSGDKGPRDEFLYPEEKTKGSKELAHKLGSIFGQEVQRYSIWPEPIIQKYCHNLCRADFGSVNRSFQLE